MTERTAVAYYRCFQRYGRSLRIVVLLEYTMSLILPTTSDKE